MCVLYVTPSYITLCLELTRKMIEGGGQQAIAYSGNWETQRQELHQGKKWKRKPGLCSFHFRTVLISQWQRANWPLQIHMEWLTLAKKKNKNYIYMYIYKWKTQASLSSWLQMDFRHSVTQCKEEASTLGGMCSLWGSCSKKANRSEGWYKSRRHLLWEFALHENN